MFSVSQKSFNFNEIKVSSEFDSGNCSHCELIGNHNFHIWIGADHPNNTYRTWFYYSICGVPKNTMCTFTIKNMQNQSKLLREGLVPVYRVEPEQHENQQIINNGWNRINIPIHSNTIQYQDSQISWSFKHYFQSSHKHYFALFYPWSNSDNDKFLNSIQKKVKTISSIYLYRGNIIRTLQDRPVEFLFLSASSGKTHTEEQINDKYLFPGEKMKFMAFKCPKPVIVLSARVHPGEVPSSHVMTGLIEQLTSTSQVGNLLRDNFAFYIFPILNPDGVGLGHYRVDTKGINLNRCYINPSPTCQPSIYAIKKMIMHAHSQNRFFAFLDLHAHAARKGTFIYGNYSRELIKQTKVCLFPKILSLNNTDFEYAGSNFTEKNMNCKDRGDQYSKEGSGRVAIFKATKNPSCWTLECNYNMGRIVNILHPKRNNAISQKHEPNVQNLNRPIISENWQNSQKQAKQFFTITTYKELGSSICQSFLDLIEKHPNSRIQNETSYFKCVKNLKMYMAYSLLKMNVNRFEPIYKKLYYGISSESQNVQVNALKGLYYTVIKSANIPNIVAYLKSGDPSQVILPVKLKEKPIVSQTCYSKNKIRYKTILDRNLKDQNKISTKLSQNSTRLSKDTPDLKTGIQLNELKNNNVQEVVENEEQQKRHRNLICSQSERVNQRFMSNHVVSQRLMSFERDIETKKNERINHRTKLVILKIDEVGIFGRQKNSMHYRKKQSLKSRQSIKPNNILSNKKITKVGNVWNNLMKNFNN